MSLRPNLLNRNNSFLFTLLNLINGINVLTNIREVARSYSLYEDILNIGDFDYFRYLESETEDYPDNDTYRYWDKEKLKEKVAELDTILKQEKPNIIKYANILVDRLKKIENLVLFDVNGLIIYGPYTSYSIYIDQDQSTKDYTIYLWKKDNKEDGLEFNIKNKEELQKFFDDNDILVKWEENKE